MKAPPKRKGNLDHLYAVATHKEASMKAPPKRKGNVAGADTAGVDVGLNESPSEKEGK